MLSLCAFTSSSICAMILSGSLISRMSFAARPPPKPSLNRLLRPFACSWSNRPSSAILISTLWVVAIMMSLYLLGSTPSTIKRSSSPPVRMAVTWLSGKCACRSEYTLCVIILAAMSVFEKVCLMLMASDKTFCSSRGRALNAFSASANVAWP